MGKRTERNAIRLGCFLCACLAMLFLGLVGCAGGSSDGGREAAAYVGDAVIYEDEVTDYTSDFRKSAGLEDDANWASYLTQTDKTPETWREDVIRQKADRILVEQRAEDLGISIQEDVLDERIEAAQARAGAGTDEEWRVYLAQSGQTPESFRDTYAFANLEQQVLDAEAGLTDEMRSEMCDDYIHTNLADQVVRHYFAREFSLDDLDGAKACIAELSELDADKLAQQFSQEATESGEAVDLSWDFLYAESTIDPKLQLRKAKLLAGQLYDRPLKGKDAYRVVYCAEREEFGGEGSYDALSSDNLKQVISNLTMTSQWAARISQYLSELEKTADVQVVAMPEGLPYDVVE